jgi:hypothetical protein
VLVDDRRSRRRPRILAKGKRINLRNKISRGESRRKLLIRLLICRRVEDAERAKSVARQCNFAGG